MKGPWRNGTVANLWKAEAYLPVCSHRPSAVARSTIESLFKKLVTERLLKNNSGMRLLEHEDLLTRRGVMIGMWSLPTVERPRGNLTDSSGWTNKVSVYLELWSC